MTETTESVLPLNDMPEAQRHFILHWGDLGSQWGVNRSVAQIHALLYVSEYALNAEQIAEILGLARSNVSNSIKELLGYKIILKAPIPGDRRDHYIAEEDAWKVAMRVAQVRKEKEIDPAIEALALCLQSAEKDPRVSDKVKGRLNNMHEFISSMDIWYGQMVRVPTDVLSTFVKAGDKVIGLLKYLSFGKKDEKTEEKEAS